MPKPKPQPTRRWGSAEQAGALGGLSGQAFRVIAHKIPGGAVRTEGGHRLYDLDLIASFFRRDIGSNGFRHAALGEVEPGGNVW